MEEQNIVHNKRYNRVNLNRTLMYVVISSSCLWQPLDSKKKLQLLIKINSPIPYHRNFYLNYLMWHRTKSDQPHAFFNSTKSNYRELSWGCFEPFTYGLKYCFFFLNKIKNTKSIWFFFMKFLFYVKELMRLIIKKIF